jgi:hypothetical protein
MPPPEQDPPSLKRSQSKRRFEDESHSDDELNRAISSLVNAENSIEKKQYQDQILESLKLTKESPGEIGAVLLPLLQLGYAGLRDTQQSFAAAVRNAVANRQSDDQSYHIKNRRDLFADPQGRDVLRRLVWCISYDDEETSASAIDAIASITESFPGTY